LADEQHPCPSIAVVAAQYGVPLGRARERICVSRALLEVAEALAIPFGSPVLALERVVLAADGRPVEWRMGWRDLPDGHDYAETK
jgi:DNA-binding GntR family transcriptional regulator